MSKTSITIIIAEIKVYKKNKNKYKLNTLLCDFSNYYFMNENSLNLVLY
jgi:hypothetical protein